MVLRVLAENGSVGQQFALLAELGLDHGERVSLSVSGHQTAPDSLEARVHCCLVGKYPVKEFFADQFYGIHGHTNFVHAQLANRL